MGASGYGELEKLCDSRMAAIAATRKEQKRRELPLFVPFSIYILGVTGAVWILSLTIVSINSFLRYKSLLTVSMI